MIPVSQLPELGSFARPLDRGILYETLRTISLRAVQDDFTIASTAPITVNETEGGSAPLFTSPITLGLEVPLAVEFGGTGVAIAAANTVFAGPVAGPPAAPAFRALVTADIPAGAIPATSISYSQTDALGMLATTGVTTVQLALDEVDNTMYASREPHGLEMTSYKTPVETTITYVPGTRTFSIAPKAPLTTFDVWVRGRRFTFSSTQSVVHAATEGQWFFYFNASGVLVASQTVWTLKSQCPVALIYWDNTNSTNIALCEERHGITMDSATHQYLHTTVGTRYRSGLTFGNFTLSSNGVITGSLTDGEIADEDIVVEITHANAPGTNQFEQFLSGATLKALIPIYYRSGAAGDWRKVAANVNGYLVDGPGANNRHYYNQFTGGAWQKTQNAGGDFSAMWIMGTDNISEPIIAVMGQRTDGTLNNARANNTIESLAWGNLAFQEFKVLYRLIFSATGAAAWPNAIQLRDVTDLRSISNLPAGTFTATSHAILTDLGYAASGHSGFVGAAGTPVLNTLPYYTDVTNPTSPLVSGADALIYDSTLSGGSLGIGIAPSASARLTILSDPAQSTTLHLYGGFGDVASVDFWDATGASNQGAVRAGNAEMTIDTLTTNGLILQPGGGKVGVGITPSVKFDVQTSLANDRAVRGVHEAVTGTNYAGEFAAQGVGAATNVGVHASASGATTNRGIHIFSPSASADNWAIYSDATAHSYFAGRVGIGIATPGFPLDVVTTLAGDSAIRAAHGAVTGTNIGVEAFASGVGADENVGLFVYATGGVTTNRGVRITAVPAAADNWALFSDAAAKSYFAGDVGIGVAPSTPLHARGTVRIDIASGASTDFRYDNALFGVTNPELEITNSNAASGGFKWNVAALRAQSADQYSALTFRQPDGRERGAIGFGNSGTDAPYLGTTYFESSFFPFSGVTVPPNLLFVQAGYMGGSNGSRRRLEFQGADGIVNFYKTDGTTKMLSMDTVNGYFGLNSGGSFAGAGVSGLYFGIGANPQIMTIVSTADHAIVKLDANGAGKVPGMDLWYGGVKKSDLYWQNSAPAHLVIADISATLVTICENSGFLALGSTATTYKVTNAGATNTGRVMVTPLAGSGRLNVDFDESGASGTTIGINGLVNNTSGNIVRTVGLLCSAPVRTAGSETGQFAIHLKPAGGAIAQVALFTSTGLVGIGAMTTPTSYLTVNANATAPVAAIADTCVHVLGVNATVPRVLVDSFGAATAFTGRRANNTAASPTGVVNNDVLAQLTGLGYTSAAAYSAAARADFQVQAAETWSATVQGARAVIRTTPIGSTTIAERVRVSESGDVGIGVTTIPTKVSILSANSGGTIDLSFVNDAAGNYRNGFANNQSGAAAHGNILSIRCSDATTSGSNIVSAFYGSGTVVLGIQAALATNATNGFTYIPTCAGVPSGVPSAFTGKVAMVYDTTNNNFYIYNGAWKKVALA